MKSEPIQILKIGILLVEHLTFQTFSTRRLKFEDLAKPNSFLNGPKFLFEPLRSVFSKDDVVLEEDEVVHNSLEITSNSVIVQKNSNCMGSLFIMAKLSQTYCID